MRCSVCGAGDGIRHRRWCPQILLFAVLNFRAWLGLEIYDPVSDTWTIHGTRISGRLLRAMSQGGRTPGPWMRVVQREGGTVSIQELTEVEP